MAPEVLLEKPYNYLADFWSLGCIIYETMAGGPLFDTKSLLQLMKLHQEDNIKWPSFLSNDCLFFLQGLLKKDPFNRLTWDEILKHTFVRGHIYIVNNGPPTPSFPNSRNHRPMTNMIKNPKHQASELLTTSQDSINAILQSDIENIETDVEDAIYLQQSIPPTFHNNLTTGPSQPGGHAFTDLCFVSGNSNMIVTNLNDNFQVQQMTQGRAMMSSRNRDLEKRKLNQNLENFSVRLGSSAKGRTTVSGQQSVVDVASIGAAEKSVLAKEPKESEGQMKDPAQSFSDSS